ncbi:MAG: WecB/TagA/CpsF family glycosyltransferase [Burkholderiaceae bacterium]|nr:WecB/TagA/CpsF family glycosyltransferase [Burkholderiaceae bacterium]
MPELLRRQRLFGVRIDVGDMTAAVAQVIGRARLRAGGLVCVANVDMLTRATQTPRLHAVMEDATAVVTDGVPLVWALRRLRREPASRVYGPGLVLELCERAEAEGLSAYFYGGMPEEVSLLEAALRQRFPRLRIAGIESPPMLAAEPPADPTTIERINASGAHLLFVGLGCPKQEFWMAAQQPQLQPIALGVGLAFALIAGTKSQAPVWMRNAGLEWFYRLCQEPGRLWKRYLVGNSRFIGYCLREWLLPHR